MNELNDGGPAFPHPNNAPEGMTLRDYFASACIPEMMRGIVAPEHTAVGMYEDIAMRCYKMADAMLKERSK